MPAVSAHGILVSILGSCLVLFLGLGDRKVSQVSMVVQGLFGGFLAWCSLHVIPCLFHEGQMGFEKSRCLQRFGLGFRTRRIDLTLNHKLITHQAGTL